MDIILSCSVCLISLAFILPAVILHEVAHGFVALLLGDDTAKRAGRLKLHTHFDWFGSFLLPISLYVLHIPALIAYAKPVPIDVGKLRRGKNDFALVAIAGPLCNLTLAFVSIFVMHLLSLRKSFILQNFAIINLYLAFFNLIPIPPFDGSRIISCILSRKIAMIYDKLERFGIFFIIILQSLSVYIFPKVGIPGTIFTYLIEIPANYTINQIHTLLA